MAKAPQVSRPTFKMRAKHRSGFIWIRQSSSIAWPATQFARVDILILCQIIHYNIIEFMKSLEFMNSRRRPRPPFPASPLSVGDMLEMLGGIRTAFRSGEEVVQALRGLSSCEATVTRVGPILEAISRVLFNRALPVAAVDAVRSRSVVPAQRATRAAVYGLLVAFFATTALTLLTIGIFRGLVILTGDAWIAHLSVGGMLVLAGGFCWSRRVKKQQPA